MQWSLEGPLPGDSSLAIPCQPAGWGEAGLAACYPRPPCTGARRDLEAAPLDYICRGPRGVWVLGKGHASIVLLGYRRGWGFLAVKVRRSDSKRESLALEASFAHRAALAGAGPRVHYWSDNVIVMDIVRGPSLGYLADRGLLGAAHVMAAVGAARALDAAGVLHHEISRPWRHVYITGRHALIIDYDSASEGCGNVPKILAGLLARLPKGLETLNLLRPLLSRYKREDCPRGVYEDIASRLEYLLRLGLARGYG